MSSFRELTVNTDGGARGNPGPAAAGAVVKDDEGKVIEQISQYLGEATNNQAEYQALKLGLQAAMKHDPEKIVCLLDSELIVRQLNGQYRVKNAELLPHYHAVKELIEDLDVSFAHVPRAQNQAADRLVNKALDERV